MGVGREATPLLVGRMLLEQLVENPRYQQAEVRVRGLQGVKEMDSSEKEAPSPPIYQNVSADSEKHRHLYTYTATAKATSADAAF